jgi:hypothetical protein
MKGYPGLCSSCTESEMSDVNALVDETLKLIECGLLEDPGEVKQVKEVRLTNGA